MKRLIVFTGAGMSAESGIPTFRGSDGLWENHRIEDVATPEAWERDPELVLTFYNQRRKGILEARPNPGHAQIARWQDEFDVTVITQNIDDLHERAGSKKVVHLHGEIWKARSTSHPELVYPLENWRLLIGDTCEKGSQLRPHIVWFGEDVPMLGVAADIVEEADIFIVVGTSLQVYPAAGLIHHAWRASQKFIVDPNAGELVTKAGWTVVADGASNGLSAVDAQMLR
ncbi:MAG: SIR2 family NAD-dependent protein deacylase [Flavobacteriales bacterium]|jgi:NAD-dependent deacetylase